LVKTNAACSGVVPQTIEIGRWRLLASATQVIERGKKSQHEGIVELGDVTARATWVEGEILLVQFSKASLDREQLRLINYLKQCPQPLSLVLDNREAEEHNAKPNLTTLPFCTSLPVRRTSSLLEPTCHGQLPAQAVGNLLGQNCPGLGQFVSFPV
jgi:hypothetical protein